MGKDPVAGLHRIARVRHAQFDRRAVVRRQPGGIARTGSTLGKYVPHRQMWYAGFHVFLAVAHETVARIERLDLRLGIEHDGAVAAFLRLFHQRAENRATDTETARLL